MADVKTFNSYNFVTGAVDGTLAYDFRNPAIFPEEEALDLPVKRPGRRVKTESREWIKEDGRTAVKTKTAAANRQGVSVFSLLGVICAIILVTMMLLAQIRLTDISSNAAALEKQIDALEVEKDKLTVEYETIFNLKDVENYAVNQLGMQEPDEEQIFYLTGVASADKAVVVTKGETDMFSVGLADLLASVKAYFS